MNRSIMIVEDEELIRRGIIARLEYLNFNPIAIYEAANGLSAMEVLKNNEVDIIITDINMSEMDGISMIKAVKPLYPDIQFIILSGFAEFEYAEQAIQLGVEAYLLKPISNEALKKVIDEVLVKLDDIEKMRRVIREGQRSIEENKGYLFDKCVNDLLRNPGEIDKNSFNAEILFEEFTVKDQWIMLAIIKIGGESYVQEQFEYKDNELVTFTIKNVYNELQSQCQKIIVSDFANINQLFALMSCSNKKQLRFEAEMLLAELHHRMWKYMGIMLTSGISSAKSEFNIDMTKEAQTALLQRIIHGNTNLYFYDDIEMLSVEQFPTSELHLLRQYIERHDAGNIEFMINDIFSDCRIKKYNVTYIKIICARIKSILLNAANTSFENEQKKIEKFVLEFESLETFSSIEAFRLDLYMFILGCIKVDASVDTNTKNKIKIAIKYIKDNYNKDIVINDLAEKYSISPNYFSTMFKRETGETTVNYIKMVRLDKACESLVNSDKSIVDISREVGYEDSQYFFRVFKKYIGQTPLQYRRTNRQ